MTFTLGMLFGGLKWIAGKIAEERTIQTNAATEQERIASEERTKALEAKRDVLIAEAGSPWNAIMRGVISLPVAIFLWKVIVIDKVLGWGSTDDLSPNLWYVVMLVLGFYFVQDTLSRWKR